MHYSSMDEKPLFRRVSQSKLTATEQMKKELGECPRFVFDQETSVYWNSLATDILQVNEVMSKSSIPESPSKILKLQRLESIFYDQTPDTSPIHQQPKISVVREISQHNILSAKRTQNKQKKKQPKMYSQKWNIEYHIQYNNIRGARIATLDARNYEVNNMIAEQDVMQQNKLIHFYSFRRKSCECQIEGQLGTKFKRFANVKMEINMHKKKRMANLLIDNLKQPRRASTFGKHQNKISMLRWAKVKGTNDQPLTPQVERSNSFIDAEALANFVNQRVDDEVLINQAPPRRQAKFMTIQQPIHRSNKSILQSPERLLEEPDESLGFTSPMKRSSIVQQIDLKKLNKAQIQIYYPKFHNRQLSDVGTVYLKRSIDSTYVKEQNIVRTSKYDTQYRSTQILLPPLQQTLTLQQSDRLEQKQKSKTYLSVYLRHKSTTQKNHDSKNLENYFKSGKMIQSGVHRKTVLKI